MALHCISRAPRSGAFFGDLLIAFLVTSSLGTAGNANAVADEADVSSTDTLKSLSVEELMDIEVTSVSKRPEKLLDAAAAIQVITGEDIRRSGSTSIPQALRLASNLNVAQQNSQEWIISARGFSSDVGNKLLVLMDGRTLYTPLFSGVFWYRQDYLLEDLDRIEVISGPGGALWGANAVNGVINITSKSARQTQGLYLEGGSGTTLEGFTGVRYGGTLGSNAHYRVYGKYFERDSEALANGSNAFDGWHAGQGGFRIDAQPSSRDALTLQADYYGTETKEEILPGRPAETRGGNILGRWSRTFSDDSDMSLQMYYDRTSLSLPVPPFFINGFVLSSAGVFRDVLDTVDVDFQHRFSGIGRHHFVWGLGYRYTYDDLDNAPALGFLPEKLQQDLFSGFIQDEITLLDDKVFLTLGTKLEHNDYTGFEVEPSARLQWNVSDRHMLWSAVSRAVRTPSRIDRDISQPAPPNLVVLSGGSAFDSETVVAYELGHRAQLGSRIAGSISAFYNEYDDVRSTSFTPVTLLPLFFENNVKGDTYGIELAVNYQALDWWRLRAGYNFLEEDIRVKPGRFDFNNALNETADPQNQASLRSSMDLAYNLELDVALRWIDELPTNNAGVLAIVPSYAELDIRLGWRPLPTLELSVVGQNLLHGRHAEFGLPSPTQEQIERSVYGKFLWRF